MRNWTITDAKDQGCLKAAKRADDNGGTWRPEDGRYARARRLAKAGFLRKAGVSVMPPHTTYVLTDMGFEELQVAAALAQDNLVAEQGEKLMTDAPETNNLYLRNPVFECPVHGLTEHYIQSHILGYEGYWCQICWLECLDRLGVARMKPAGDRPALSQEQQTGGNK